MRAAHEQFASIPARRAPPGPVFAQHYHEAAPTLALLRVEPPIAEEAPDDVAAASAPIAQAPDATEPAATTPAEPEKLAALKLEDSAPPEVARPEPLPAETMPAARAVPAEAETPAPAPVEETTLAALADAPAATEVARAVPDQANETPSPETGMAAARIATPGGQAVAIEEETSAKPAEAKPDRDAIRKRIRARRARERRRIAQRALLAQQLQHQQQPLQVAAQPPTDPFAQLIGR
ncbi:hypothetical protein [Bradyrhizobium sp.]|uniref:hypothetical protein n=1 Tax=Bradyrhizobium sp. TaxID=376 RepID=UPI003C777A6B